MNPVIGTFMFMAFGYAFFTQGEVRGLCAVSGVLLFIIAVMVGR